MALLPYGLARPFLFNLDPEAAHEMTIDALARGAGLEEAADHANAAAALSVTGIGAVDAMPTLQQVLDFL